MALKAEVESLAETSRIQNIENLTLMKGLTKTIQVLKDNDRFFKENDTNTKDVLANIVEYSNQINKLMNAQAKIVGGEDADGSMSIEGKKASGGTFMTSMQSKTALSNNKEANQ